MTERYVDVPGARLLTLDDGAGPPIVLLHAGVADLRSWDALTPLLVAAGHRVATTASPRYHDAMRRLGAEVVVDYRNPGAVAELVAGIGGADVAGVLAVARGRPSRPSRSRSRRARRASRSPAPPSRSARCRAGHGSARRSSGR